VLSDALIGELVTADVIVLAVPMHNFGIPFNTQGVDRSRRARRAHVYLFERDRRFT